MSFFTEEVRRNPYPVYEQLRAGSPVHMPGADLWAILDYGGVKRVLSDAEAFSSNAAPSRGGAFEWLLFMDPPRHTELRSLILKAFTPRSIAALEPRVREISSELLARVLQRGEMDVIDDFAAPLPMMVIAGMLGVDPADWRRLKGWADAIMGLADTIAGAAEQAFAAGEAFRAADTEMKTYLDEHVALRRATPRDDLLGRLALAELGDQEILRFVQLLLAAGTETTMNLVGNAVRCFLECPAELARLRADPSLLPSAIEEVLRYRSPLQAVFRATRREVGVGGRVIPAGKFVLALLGAANRDPAHFPEPDRFDVTRTPNPHLAFGHGIHFCLGAPLSRLEARVALADLLRSAGDLEPASDAAWAPRPAFHVHGLTRLPIRFKPS